MNCLDVSNLDSLCHCFYDCKTLKSLDVSTWNTSNVKTIEENSTVGIIICKQDNEYVIKYCSDNRIIVRKYELI